MMNFLRPFSPAEEMQRDEIQKENVVKRSNVVPIKGNKGKQPENEK